MSCVLVFPGDLSVALKERKGKPLAEDAIMDWFAQICLGLKHMHDRHVMHRDLKAQNIFLTKVGALCGGWGWRALDA